MSPWLCASGAHTRIPTPPPAKRSGKPNDVQNNESRGGSPGAAGFVHNKPAECNEAFRIQGFGEEVSEVVGSGHMRHGELKLLDHVSDEEVAPLNMLRTVMVLRVIRKVTRGLVVRAEFCGRIRSAVPAIISLDNTSAATVHA